MRIEDTDQSRYVAGAEEYIVNCLAWCGLLPDEGPASGGPYGPYRQSERKQLYRQFAEQLVQQGHAYYAFDTPGELEAMREKFKTPEKPSPQYDHTLRGNMRNSLTLTPAEVQQLLSNDISHVIRIRMPEHETVSFTDMIRGEVIFDTSTLDDKVLLKADGMPTYHLAVVVDDYFMKITHAFRGEEWLPSAPVHILLWKYLGWEQDMPQWAHLPLILKPDGNGKLSKRDGDRLGFPVFAMSWTDPRTGELTRGFRELGFLPEAFINMLAMLGWNNGSDQEIFTIEELVQQFSMDRVHKGGAKFDFEKAKWFNHEWIKRSGDMQLLQPVKGILEEKGIAVKDNDYLLRVIHLIKERCTLLTDFYVNSAFFFEAPRELDVAAVKPKWNEAKKDFFVSLAGLLRDTPVWEAALVEQRFKELAAARAMKPGDVLMPLRVMLVGGKFGPGVFDIAALLGREATTERIEHALKAFD